MKRGDPVKVDGKDGRVTDIIEGEGYMVYISSEDRFVQIKEETEDERKDSSH